MDFFQKQIGQEQASSLSFPSPEHDNDPDSSTVQDSITSLMNMADKMEALLPPEVALDIPLPSQTCEISPKGGSEDLGGFQDCLSTVTGSTLKIDLKPPTLDLPDVSLDADVFSQADGQSTAATVAPYSSADVTDVSGPLAGMPVYGSPHGRGFSGQEVRTQQVISGLEATSCASPAGESSSGVRGSFDKMAFSNAASFLPDENNSPCAIRDLRDMPRSLADSLPRVAVQKPRKTTRKPKTYSKPVASRFCHICSRMPRRGQGSATCRRMAEGFCRKIVCEQCLREQGWNYEDIAKNPSTWLCPHCAEICPPRSQCHIYNRINARRKRAGPQKQAASVAAALASSDLLLGPYGHLFSGGQTPSTQILQPPPNFRLNLPPQYSQQ